MKRNYLTLGVCAIAITAVISAMSIKGGAESDRTKLPAAGAAAAIGEGTSYEDLQEEVKKCLIAMNVSPEERPLEIVEENVKNEELAQAEDLLDETDEEGIVDDGAAVAEEEETFENLVIAQVNDYVNVRSEASTDSDIVGKLYDDSVGEFVSEEDGWYLIESGNVRGYVKAEYCVTGEEAEALVDEVGTRFATVNTTTLKVRKDASTESSVLGLVPIEEDLLVEEELDGWVKVSIEEGEGYVSEEFVDLRTDFVHAESKEEEEARLAKEKEARRLAAEAARKATANNNSTSSSSKSDVVYTSTGGDGMGKSVADYALQFVGNPYVYGGSSLTEGTDCSGFVMSVYNNFGVSLPHSSKADRTEGYAVDGIENAQPGDIVCYSGHVAIYIGNGQIVHASTSKTGIIVSNADHKKILAVRRIF